MASSRLPPPAGGARSRLRERRSGGQAAGRPGQSPASGGSHRFPSEGRKTDIPPPQRAGEGNPTSAAGPRAATPPTPTPTPPGGAAAGQGHSGRPSPRVGRPRGRLRGGGGKSPPASARLPRHRSPLLSPASPRSPRPDRNRRRVPAARETPSSAGTCPPPPPASPASPGRNHPARKGGDRDGPRASERARAGSFATLAGQAAAYSHRRSQTVQDGAIES